MDYQSINLKEKFTQFSEIFSPKIIAQMNDYYFKLGRTKGEFVWHTHAETDETFIIFVGKMDIEFRDGKVELKEGEMFVVPKGVEHKPVAREECKIMMIEPVGTINTGNAPGEMTKEDVWI